MNHTNVTVTEEEEVWKDMVGHEHLYQISNKGNIYSKITNKIVKSSYDDKGYKIRTHKVNGKAYVVKVHRAVALAFIPNVDNKPFVNHKNGIKDDNNVSNLEWVDGFENQQHCVAISPKRRDVGHAHAKLTEEDVRYIRENPDNLSQAELSKKFDVHQSRISQVKCGKTYKAILP